MRTKVIQSEPAKERSTIRRALFRRVRRFLLFALCFIFALTLIGRDDYQPDEIQAKNIARLFSGSNFDLIGWEVNAIRSKAGTLFQDPASGIDDEQARTLVRTYL